MAVFLPLAACAPFWLGGWGSDGPGEATGANARRQATNLPDRAGTISELPQTLYLAATAPDAPPIAAANPPAIAARPHTPRPAGSPGGTPLPLDASAKPRPQTRTMRMLVTAYCPCEKCCRGASDGITACGKSIYANNSRFVAADTRLLGFGTRVSVPGYYGGAPISVLDRGGRIKGHRIDVFFLSHQRAQSWGARWMDVTVYEN